MLRNLIKNKQGGYTDIFLFMIVAIIIVFVSVIFIYAGTEIESKLHETLDNKTTDYGSANYSRSIDNTFGDINYSYSILKWITFFLIMGMIVAIFIGSYMVTTKPIFFVPYIFVIIIAVVVAAGISTAYGQVINNADLGATFSQFIGTNFILTHLPIWVSIIGIGGGIIMFTRMQQGREY